MIMKLLALIIMTSVSSILTFSQTIEGSWKLIEENGESLNNKEIIAIFQDGYMALGAKESSNNAFLYAYGGAFSISEEVLTLIQDFNTKQPDMIGMEQSFQLKIEEGKIKLSNTKNSQIWEQISESKDDLTRNWVFTGREKDGEVQITTPGDRRTVKILSGNRFQWIAFNSATKEFSGTGGGTYAIKDGRYIENITFFSRNNDRVGAKLEFQYEVNDEKWHHRGKSSAGDPIFEIWSPYEEAYKK